MYPSDVDNLIKARTKKWFPDPEANASWRLNWGGLNLFTLGIMGALFGTKGYHPNILSKNSTSPKTNILNEKKKIQKVLASDLFAKDDSEILFSVNERLIFTEKYFHYKLSRDKSLMASLKDDSVGSIPLNELKSIEIGKKNFVDDQSIKVNGEIIGAINFVKSDRLSDFLTAIVKSLKS